MPRARSRVVALSSAFLAIYRALQYKTNSNAIIRRQRRTRKLVADRQAMPSKARRILGVDTIDVGDKAVDYLDDCDKSFHSENISPTDTDATSPTLCEPGYIGPLNSADEIKLPVVAERRDSAQSGVTFLHESSSPDETAYSIVQCIPGGKILEHPMQEEYDEQYNTDDRLEQDISLPLSRSPSLESESSLSFTPLSPPPSHRLSRKTDAIIGPDDPRNSEIPLCRCVPHKFTP